MLSIARRAATDEIITLLLGALPATLPDAEAHCQITLLRSMPRRIGSGNTQCDAGMHWAQMGHHEPDSPDTGLLGRYCA